MDKFSKELHPKIGNYIFLLIDHRDKSIFYVGKGQGDSIFANSKSVLKETEQSPLSPKIELIKEIQVDGKEVDYRIVRWNLDNENQAYEIESVLIELLTNEGLKKSGGLKNKIDRGHSPNYGIQTPKEIEAILIRGERNISNLKDRLIAITLCQSLEGPSLYSRVRENWDISPKHAKQADFVLGVYNGVVIGVFKPVRWDEMEDPHILDRHLHKMFPCKSKGNSNPIKYLFY